MVYVPFKTCRKPLCSPNMHTLCQPQGDELARTVYLPLPLHYFDRRRVTIIHQVDYRVPDRLHIYMICVIFYLQWYRHHIEGAARILTGNCDYVNTRGINLVNTLGLMNVSQRRDYFMIMLMFKSIHGLVPNYLCDEITMQRDIAERTTRSTIDNNVHVPHITLECCKNAFAYRGPVLWNALPENIKKCESLNGFKQCVKLHVVG